MKVGDLVKWTNEFNPDYYEGNADGLVMKVTHYDDAVDTVVIDVLMRGNVVRWNSKSCEVVNESR
jgi:hypothetical protein